MSISKRSLLQDKPTCNFTLAQIAKRIRDNILLNFLYAVKTVSVSLASDDEKRSGLRNENRKVWTPQKMVDLRSVNPTYDTSVD